MSAKPMPAHVGAMAELYAGWMFEVQRLSAGAAACGGPLPRWVRPGSETRN